MFRSSTLIQASKRLKSGDSKNVVSPSVDRFIYRRNNKTMIRFYEGGGTSFYKSRQYGKNARLANLMARDIHLDSLQSDPEYIKSIQRSHNFHKPHDQASKKRYTLLTGQHSEVLVDYVAVSVSLIETEGFFETVARVSVVDGNLNVLLDKYIVPLGGKVLNFRYKATGITKENLEEYGEPFEAVRDEFAKAIGIKTIIGHSIAEVFVALEFNPRHFNNNKIIDVAHNNRINFDMMVFNNYRHKGIIGLNAIAYILLHKNVNIERQSALDDAETVMKLFHYIYAKDAEIKALAKTRKHISSTALASI